MTERRQLTARTVSRGEAEYWHFTFEAGGWAIFNINERTGEFSIQSDWGDYSHRWPVDHIGSESMKHFVAKCNAEYIMRKFAYTLPRDVTNRFDPERTRRGFRERIIERRTSELITKRQARQCWDDLDEVFDRMASYGGTGEAQIVVLHEYWPESMCDHAHICDMHEWFHYAPSPRYVFALEVLIPFFQAHLKEQLKPAELMGKADLG